MSMTTFRVINVHLNPFIQLISGQSLPEAEIYKYPVGPTRGLKKKYVKNSDAIFFVSSCSSVSYHDDRDFGR